MWEVAAAPEVLSCLESDGLFAFPHRFSAIRAQGCLLFCGLLLHGSRTFLGEILCKAAIFLEFLQQPLHLSLQYSYQSTAKDKHCISAHKRVFMLYPFVELCLLIDDMLAYIQHQIVAI